MPRQFSNKPPLPSLQFNYPRLNDSLGHPISSANQYIRLGLAKSTLKTYNSAWSYYSSFCIAHAVSTVPVDISTVCAFIVHCFESKKLQASSIKALVSGIQFLLRCLVPEMQSLLKNPSVILLLNGLKKESP